MENCPRGVFVTGTGTDVGKTFVSALLLKHLRESGVNAGYFKAALSGMDEDGIPGDAAFVCREAGLPGSPSEYVAYCYQTAVSPHLAAKIEGNPPDLVGIQAAFDRISRRHSFVLVEGSGGIICPLRFDETVIMLTDVIKQLDLPVLVVADAGLGTINSTVLTIEYARAQGLNLAGVILNRFEEDNFLHRDNLQMIEKLTGIHPACLVNNVFRGL